MPATPKKPAAKKKPAPRRAVGGTPEPPGAARGAALVERVIAKLAGTLPTDAMLDGPDDAAPAPLDAATLAAAALADGAPLPASVRRWLAYDGAWQPLRFHARSRRLKAARLSAVLAARHPDLAGQFDALDASLLPGDCYPVLTPQVCHEETVLFLYASPDAAGELPVLGVDFQDGPVLGVFAPGFDLYLARVSDAIAWPHYALGAGPAAYARASRDALARVAGRKYAKRVYQDTIGLTGLLG